MAASHRPISERTLPAAAAAVLVTLAVRAYVASHYGLTDDEAYYRLWALSPALSYLDHPPMVGWWIAAGRFIAGDTQLGVRLMQLLAFVAGTVAIWRGTHLLFGADVAARAVWISLAMPLLGAGGIVITPDGPSVLSAALVYWALAELVKSNDGRWWLAVGLFAGLGLLSKYTNLFLGAGIVAFLLIAPGQRRWLGRWQLWAGGAIAVLMASPVIVWNAQHDWASFAKQFGRVADGNGLTGKYLLEMFGAFVALASPVIAGLAAIGIWSSARLARARAEAALLTALIVPFLVYFIAHAMHDRVQANWLAPVYPALAVAAAHAVQTSIADRWRAAVSVAAVAIGLGMTGLLYAHALNPLDGGALRKDPTRQGHGWAELARDADRLRAASGAAWLTTSSYATTGQLAFALKDDTPVIQLDERLRYVHLPAPSPDLLERPALYVELARREDAAQLHRMFTQVQRLPDLVRRGSGYEIDRYAVYLVRGGRGDMLSRP